MGFDTWESVESLLLQLSKEDGYKPSKGEKTKKGSPLISPAIYHKKSKRCNADVQGWGGWAALDVDDYSCSYQEAIAPFQAYRHVIYSSASSTIEHPKFRVVIPFNRHIAKDEIKHAWYALNIEFNSLGDPQTKDLSRMYYVPACYPDAYNFIECHVDAPFMNASELLDKHPYAQAQDNSFRSKLSAELQEQLMNYRKERLTNTQIKWSCYRDCPFVSKKIIAEYRSISETGWYHKMFQLMCSIAFNAIRMDYPISAAEIARLAKEIDQETGGWYKHRPLEMEAARAIEYALASN